MYDKFRNIKVISQDKYNTEVKIEVFEDGFIKWLMSQSVEVITVLYPEGTIKKIREKTKSIMNKYGGVNEWQKK